MPGEPSSGTNFSPTLQNTNVASLTQSKVLESLSHLRIDSARIKPIHSQALRIGGNADVEAAILASDLPPSSSEPDVTEYVAVKKLRFDTETDDDRVLAVSLARCSVHAMKKSEKFAFIFQAVRSRSQSSERPVPRQRGKGYWLRRERR